VSDANPASTGCAIATHLAVPPVHRFVTPIVYAVPVQLIAYYTATFMGTDVDQPRNLAKSVTVE
jgi:glucosamine--fructose-6-phosphate aminotransferase (isomerizing)